MTVLVSLPDPSPQRWRSDDRGREQDDGDGGDDEAVPGEDRQVVPRQVGDQPPDREDRGDEGEHGADEWIDDPELVDERATVLDEFEQRRRGERDEPEEEAELDGGGHRYPDEQCADDGGEGAA